MEVDNYQRAAARTLIDKPDFILTPEHAQVVTGMIRLGAAIGGIMEYVKKGIFHQHGFDLAEFQRRIDAIDLIDTISTVALDDAAVMMIWNAIGYIGEACEVAGLLEETILQGKPLDVAELGKELGDGAWYPAALATRAGLRMSDVLAANLDKLRKRYPNGYSAADSVARVDVAEPAPGERLPACSICGATPAIYHEHPNGRYPYCAEHWPSNIVYNRDGSICDYVVTMPPTDPAIRIEPYGTVPDGVTTEHKDMMEHACPCGRWNVCRCNDA